MSAYVVGGGMIRMGRHPQSSYVGLAAPAVLRALESAGVSLSEVGSVACGHSFGGPLVGQRIMSRLGGGHVPVTNIDNACSGGGTALRTAIQDVESGRVDVALAIGVDSLTQFGKGTLPLPEADIETESGLVMPALYAMRARRFLHERNASVSDLAAVSVKNRRHGSINPYAQFTSEVTEEEVLAARPVADPLTLLQCCPTGDGAAATVVVSEAVRQRLDGPAVRVLASVLHSGEYIGGFRDMLTPEISAASARDAYEMAGVGPEDIDMVELHDAFTIAELVYYETLGLCAKGDAVPFLRSGGSTYGGNVVVNPSGGLLSRGHPVGATGMAQVVESFWQLTNQAGARQVGGARLALTHVTGGGIAGLDHGACSIHILESV
ncbi:thiolase family protein [Rhodococcus fascians]|nr:thiolase family protein [Rhodococcus fascians]MBY3998480.1 thiolase family protein [Rhodococcus fascians]MBY4004525.1 thiolase family protein [Rhodococcus fascians]MBY4009293.1 thiolase family protein [Rhodococcus fascians]MBY4019732.1 thiolase family protein [Rhodococcus fascians]